VWKKAYKLLGNDADAAECFQQTFLDAQRKTKTKYTRDYPALLDNLATLKAVEILRKRTQQEKIKNGKTVLDESFDKNQGPPQQVQRIELAAALRDALGKIPEKEAQIFVLSNFNDVSYRQIAKLLNMNKPAVGTLLHRAREKIKKNIQETLDKYK